MKRSGPRPKRKNPRRRKKTPTVGFPEELGFRVHFLCWVRYMFVFCWMLLVLVLRESVGVFVICGNRKWRKNGGGVRNRFGACGVSERSTHSFPRCGYVGIYPSLLHHIFSFLLVSLPQNSGLGFGGAWDLVLGSRDFFGFILRGFSLALDTKEGWRRFFSASGGGGFVVGLYCCCVATEEAKKRLSEAGFVQISERHPWNVEAGGKYFFTRNHSTIIAFAIGNKCASNPCLLLFCLVTSHTHIHFLAKLPEPQLVQYLSGCKSFAWVLGFRVAWSVLHDSSVERIFCRISPSCCSHACFKRLQNHQCILLLLTWIQQLLFWRLLIIMQSGSTYLSTTQAPHSQVQQNLFHSMVVLHGFLLTIDVCIFCRYTTGNGFLIIGAHTDSPCPKLKPVSKVQPFFSLLNFYCLYTYKSALLGADEVVSGKSLINGRS